MSKITNTEKSNAVRPHYHVNNSAWGQVIDQLFSSKQNSFCEKILLENTETKGNLLSSPYIPTVVMN